MKGEITQMNGEMDISPAEWRVMRVVWTLGQAR